MTDNNDITTEDKKTITVINTGQTPIPITDGAVYSEWVDVDADDPLLEGLIERGFLLVKLEPEPDPEPESDTNTVQGREVLSDSAPAPAASRAGKPSGRRSQSTNTDSGKADK